MDDLEGIQDELLWRLAELKRKQNGLVGEAHVESTQPENDTKDYPYPIHSRAPRSDAFALALLPHSEGLSCGSMLGGLMGQTSPSSVFSDMDLTVMAVFVNVSLLYAVVGPLLQALADRNEISREAAGVASVTKTLNKILRDLNGADWKSTMTLLLSVACFSDRFTLATIASGGAGVGFTNETQGFIQLIDTVGDAFGKYCPSMDERRAQLFIEAAVEGVAEYKENTANGLVLKVVPSSGSEAESNLAKNIRDAFQTYAPHTRPMKATLELQEVGKQVKRRLMEKEGYLQILFGYLQGTIEFGDRLIRSIDLFAAVESLFKPFAQLPETPVFANATLNAADLIQSISFAANVNADVYGERELLEHELTSFVAEIVSIERGDVCASFAHVLESENKLKLLSKRIDLFIAEKRAEVADHQKSVLELKDRVQFLSDEDALSEGVHSAATFQAMIQVKSAAAMQAVKIKSNLQLASHIHKLEHSSAFRSKFFEGLGAYNKAEGVYGMSNDLELAAMRYVAGNETEQTVIWDHIFKHIKALPGCGDDLLDEMPPHESLAQFISGSPEKLAILQFFFYDYMRRATERMCGYDPPKIDPIRLLEVLPQAGDLDKMVSWASGENLRYASQQIHLFQFPVVRYIVALFAGLEIGAAHNPTTRKPGMREGGNVLAALGYELYMLSTPADFRNATLTNVFNGLAYKTLTSAATVGIYSQIVAALPSVTAAAATSIGGGGAFLAGMSNPITATAGAVAFMGGAVMLPYATGGPDPFTELSNRATDILFTLIGLMVGSRSKFSPLNRVKWWQNVLILAVPAELMVLAHAHEYALGRYTEAVILDSVREAILAHEDGGDDRVRSLAASIVAKHGFPTDTVRAAIMATQNGERVTVVKFMIDPLAFVQHYYFPILLAGVGLAVGMGYRQRSLGGVQRMLQGGFQPHAPLVMPTSTPSLSSGRRQQQPAAATPTPRRQLVPPPAPTQRRMEQRMVEQPPQPPPQEPSTSRRQLVPPPPQPPTQRRMVVAVPTQPKSMEEMLLRDESMWTLESLQRIAEDKAKTKEFARLIDANKEIYAKYKKLNFLPPFDIVNALKSARISRAAQQ
jgi:hypothetical protein